MKTIFFMLCILGLSLACYAQNDLDLPKTDANVDEVVVSPPEFTGIPGYLKATKNDPDLIRKYLASQVIYPQEALRCGSEGTELIEFTVTADGNLKNIRIINHVCPAIDQEMISALKTTEGMWKPGLQNGQPKDMDYHLYLTFTMQHEGDNAWDYLLDKMETYFKTGSKQMIEKQHFARAEKCFDKAVTLWPFEPNVLLLRGLCSYELGKTSEAIEDWERVRDLTGIDFGNEYLTEEYKHYKGYDALTRIFKKEESKSN